MKSAVASLCLLLLSLALFSQGPREKSKGNGVIYGSVVANGEAMPYASVSLFNAVNDQLVTGIISEENGKFRFDELKNGDYYLQVTFVGFSTEKSDMITISPEKHIIKTGDIELKPSSEQLQEIEVTSNLPSMEYHIDKKVVNVDKQITAAAGTAVDILQNVPSVNVDVTGEVSLRGSTGFMVFIDGRPSVLSGSEALTQIPSSTIDKIEIITNPSAKYDPDGTSGIINIVTKKNVLEGFSGIINGNIGWDDKYGGDALFYYRKNKLNYFIGGDYNHRYFPGGSRIDRYTISNDTTYLTKADGETERTRTNYRIRGGLEYNLSAKDFITVNATLGYREFSNSSVLDYRETSTPFTNIYDYTSLNLHDRNGIFYSISSDYEHKFATEQHKIAAQVVYNHYEMNEVNNNELVESDGTVNYGQQSTERGPTTSWRTKLDYTLPLSKTAKFESGLQARIDQTTDTNMVYNLNNSTNEYEFQDIYSNQVQYNRNIYSIYGMFNDIKKKFGYQLGLRMEYTDRFIQKLDGDSSTSLNRWDYFPTVHVSYKLPKDHQLMVSYSRRIQRPRSWYFEPFITWIDAYNVRQGNPDLLPEYIDAFELGYTKRVKKLMYSLEAYYRIKHNSIERFRSVYQENVMISTFQNVGTEYSLGIEGMISTDLTKWWNIDLMGNLYNFRGDYISNLINNESTNWSTRVNNTFYLTKTWQVQINGRYNSASVTAQGFREDNYIMDAAIKKTMMNRKLSFTLQGRDILMTSRYLYTSEGPDFSTEEYRRTYSPIVILTVSYRINNYKASKKDRQSGEDSGDGFRP